MLAAGNGTVGGLGLVPFYRLPLSNKDFEEMWVVQQRITLIRRREGAEETRQDAAYRRTIRMEQDGLLDQALTGLAADGLPLDPGG
jgi:hypothetical protein